MTDTDYTTSGSNEEDRGYFSSLTLLLKYMIIFNLTFYYFRTTCESLHKVYSDIRWKNSRMTFDSSFAGYLSLLQVNLTLKNSLYSYIYFCLHIRILMILTNFQLAQQSTRRDVPVR